VPVPAANPRAFSTFAGRAHGTALGAAPAVRRAFGVRYASTFKVAPRCGCALQAPSGPGADVAPRVLMLMGLLVWER